LVRFLDLVAKLLLIERWLSFSGKGKYLLSLPFLAPVVLYFLNSECISIGLRGKVSFLVKVPVRMPVELKLKGSVLEVYFKGYCD